MAVNFNLPLDLSRLENDRLKLVPPEDNLDEWMDIYVRDGQANPWVYDYLKTHPYTSGSQFAADYKQHFPNTPNELLLAVVLKAGTVTRTDRATGQTETFEVPDGTFAGFSGMAAWPERATAGMGLMLCTRFHRTFVSTHVNGLTLRHLLDGPEEGGLGLRRVEWQCNASNQASIHTAKRMGFQWEGITRWQEILPEGKAGSEGAEIDRPGLPKVGWDGKAWGAGRHTANLSLCWDDWLSGGKEHVDTMIKKYA